MTPAKSRILTCPYCGEKKEIMQIASGNTFGQIVWSDNKCEAPMLPRPSFVQKCPGCGKYYILSRQEKYEYGDSYSYEKGDLSYPEWKEAMMSMPDDLDNDEKVSVLINVVWAYNDEYRRDKEDDFETDEYAFIKPVILQLIDVLDDNLMKAEFYRELGMMDEARQMINNESRTEDFLVKIKNSILERVNNNDTSIFRLS